MIKIAIRQCEDRWVASIPALEFHAEGATWREVLMSALEAIGAAFDGPRTVMVSLGAQESP